MISPVGTVIPVEANGCSRVHASAPVLPARDGRHVVIALLRKLSTGCLWGSTREKTHDGYRLIRDQAARPRETRLPWSCYEPAQSGSGPQPRQQRRDCRSGCVAIRRVGLEPNTGTHGTILRWRGRCAVLMWRAQLFPPPEDRQRSLR